MEELEDETEQGEEEAEEEAEEGLIEQEISGLEQYVLEGQAILQPGEVAGEAEPELEGEAEAKAPAEQPGEQEQAESGQGGTCTWSPLEVLRALQLEMEPVNLEASRAFCRLKRKTWQRRRPYLELRSTTIQRIPGFWAKAVSLMVGARDHSAPAPVKERATSGER